MKNLIIFIALISIIGIGCSPVYYIPNTQNVPLLTQKGDVNLSGSIELDGATVQSAVAVSDYVGVQLNYSHFSQTESNANGSGNIYEAGVGYFSKFEKGGIYEAYGLLGVGNVVNQINGDSQNSRFTGSIVKSNFTRVGFQQNLGFKFKYFEAATSLRLSRLDYRNIEGDLAYLMVSQVSYLKDNSINYLCEPALTLKVGFEKVKLQMQIQYSFNLSNKQFYRDDIGASLGLIVDFNQH